MIKLNTIKINTIKICENYIKINDRAFSYNSISYNTLNFIYMNYLKSEWFIINCLNPDCYDKFIPLIKNVFIANNYKFLICNKLDFHFYKLLGLKEMYIELNDWVNSKNTTNIIINKV